jgi:hypothetical protein
MNHYRMIYLHTMTYCHQEVSVSYYLFKNGSITILIIFFHKESSQKFQDDIDNVLGSLDD